MKKIWVFILKIAIAVLIISYLIHRHYSSITDGLKNFDIRWLIPALLILYFEMTACAVRWFYLLKTANINLSCREAISLTMRGYFCSLILPGGAVGGDVAKIGMIAHSMQKGERFEPGLSILIDRIVGMIALFLTAIILVIADYGTLLRVDFSSLGIVDEYNKYLIWIVLLICIAGIGAAMVLFFFEIFEKIPFVKVIFAKADTISKGLVSRIKLALALYKKHWKSLFWLTVGSIVFVHLIQMPILVCICAGLGIEIPSLLNLTAAIILGNIAGLIPLTPGGIGLRDIVILAVLSAENFSGASSIPLLMSLVLIIGNLSVGIFFFDRGLQKKENLNKDSNLQGAL